MPGAAILTHFLDSQLWAVLKEILRVFDPNRVRVLEFMPVRIRTAEFDPVRVRVVEFMPDRIRVAEFDPVRARVFDRPGQGAKN